jgi:alpha-1,6-mannosyltransferase
VGFYHSDLVRTYAEPMVPSRLGAPLRVLTRNLARAYVRNLYGHFDVTIAASPAVTIELRELGVRDVRYVPLGVDIDVFSPCDRDRSWLRQQLGIGSSRPIALFAGRLCAEKRLDVVLDALPRIGPQERPHLVLVGDGPVRATIESASARPAHVSILPFIGDRHELARVYRAADFYVAAGPGETFGLAIAEAMACGLPVVCVDRGAAPDRVRGSGCAELYRHGDAESCASALRRMASRLSPDLRAAASRHVAAHCGWQRTFDRLVNVYDELARGYVTA